MNTHGPNEVERLSAVIIPPRDRLTFSRVPSSCVSLSRRQQRNTVESRSAVRHSKGSRKVEVRTTSHKTTDKHAEEGRSSQAHRPTSKKPTKLAYWAATDQSKDRLTCCIVPAITKFVDARRCDSTAPTASCTVKLVGGLVARHLRGIC